MTFRRWTAALLASTMIHGAIAGGYVEYKERPLRNYLAQLHERYLDNARKREIQKEREKLVQEAREQEKQGKLKLGSFILRANYLDAKEEGQEFDMKKAAKLYNEYWQRLYDAIEKGRSIQEAIPEVLGHLSYEGIPGGRMADALFEKGGSCNKLSHLIAALVYDLGYKDLVQLRFYGPNKDGYTHLAPIFVDQGKEHDLVAGQEAYKKGVRFPASQLIEAYAKAHGLAKQDIEKGARVSRTTPETKEGKPSGFSYPFTEESYPGTTPIFATDAIRKFRMDNQDERADEIKNSSNVMLALDLPFLGDLLDPTLPANKETDRIWVRLTQANEFEVDGIFEKIGKIKKGRPMLAYAIDLKLRLPDKKLLSIDELPAYKLLARDMYLEDYKNFEFVSSPEDLVATAALAGLYWQAGFYLSALGKSELAKKAYEERAAIIAFGEKIIAFQQGKDIEQRNEFLKELAEDHSVWGLIFLGPKADEILFGLWKRYEGEVVIQDLGILAALIASPRTTGKAMEIAERLEPYKQILVANSLIISNENRIDIEGEGLFHKVCKVFANVENRYAPWSRKIHAEVNFGELLEIVREELARNGLGGNFEAAFMSFYGKGCIGPYSDSPFSSHEDQRYARAGFQFTKELAAYLDGLNDIDEEVEKLRKQAGYMLSRGRFDNETVWSAWRLVNPKAWNDLKNAIPIRTDSE